MPEPDIHALAGRLRAVERALTDCECDEVDLPRDVTDPESRGAVTGDAPDVPDATTGDTPRPETSLADVERRLDALGATVAALGRYVEARQTAERDLTGAADAVAEATARLEREEEKAEENGDDESAERETEVATEPESETDAGGRPEAHEWFQRAAALPSAE